MSGTERDEPQAAKARDVERSTTGGAIVETRTGEQRSILALQRSAGNRAVGQLLAQRSGAPTAAAIVVPVQRAPDGPGEEERVWPVEWPEETEGERNQPCFDPGFQATIQAGAESADRAAAYLTAGPPDLERAAAELETAHGDWTSVDGSNPGRAALDEATAGVQRIGFAVSAYVLPVGERLDILRQGAMDAFSSISDAAGSMTEPEAGGGEPEPCFVDQQQVAIQKAATLAFGAAGELAKRPPDYPAALAMLKKSADGIRSVKGGDPGQASLTTAVKMLDEVTIQVRVYLTPVETVVAEAAAGAKVLAQQARAAAEMSRRGRYAEGEEAEGSEAATYAAPGGGAGAGT